jgi:hypothetical protein
MPHALWGAGPVLGAAIRVTSRTDELRNSLAERDKTHSNKWNSTFLYAYMKFPKNINIIMYTSVCSSVWMRNFVTDIKFEVFAAVTMKNVVFWDIKVQFVLHRGHITSPLQSTAS